MQTRTICWRFAQQRGADLLFILMWSLLLMSFVPLLQALVQELNFCAYLGLPAFMIPLRGPHCANLARILLNHIHTGHHSCMVMAICSIGWKQICSERTIICLCIHPGPIIYTQSSFWLLTFAFFPPLMGINLWHEKTVYHFLLAVHLLFVIMLCALSIKVNWSDACVILNWLAV